MSAESVASVAAMLVRLFESLTPDERLAALSLLEDTFCFVCGAPVLAHVEGESCP